MADAENMKYTQSLVQGDFDRCKTIQEVSEMYSFYDNNIRNMMLQRITEIISEGDE